MNRSLRVFINVLLGLGLSACMLQATQAPSPTQTSLPPSPTVGLPQPSPTPYQASPPTKTPLTPSRAKGTPDWYSLLPSTPEPAPTPGQVRPSLPPPTPEPWQILGGGTINDGPFTFTLWVIQDPAFRHTPVAPSLYSDIEGRGIHWAWVYNGKEILTGPISEYWGLPFPKDLASVLPGGYIPQHPVAEFPRLEPGWGGGGRHGIFISPRSRSTGLVKVGFFLITPKGPYGACIQFRLTSDFQDVDPATIALDHLPCGESAASVP